MCIHSHSFARSLTISLSLALGRRQIQLRLVSPRAASLNSGDCFLLVTRDTVYAWLGEFANNVEQHRTTELADWISAHRELSYRGQADAAAAARSDGLPGSGVFVTINEGAGKSGNALKFWKELGYDQPQDAQR